MRKHNLMKLILEFILSGSNKCLSYDTRFEFDMIIETLKTTNLECSDIKYCPNRAIKFYKYSADSVDRCLASAKVSDIINNAQKVTNDVGLIKKSKLSDAIFIRYAGFKANTIEARDKLLEYILDNGILFSNDVISSPLKLDTIYKIDDCTLDICDQNTYSDIIDLELLIPVNKEQYNLIKSITDVSSSKYIEIANEEEFKFISNVIFNNNLDKYFDIAELDSKNNDIIDAILLSPKIDAEYKSETISLSEYSDLKEDKISCKHILSDGRSFSTIFDQSIKGRGGFIVEDETGRNELIKRLVRDGAIWASGLSLTEFKPDLPIGYKLNSRLNKGNDELYVTYANMDKLDKNYATQKEWLKKLKDEPGLF